MPRDVGRERTRWFPALVSNHVVDLVNKYPREQLPASLTGYIRDREGYDYLHHAEVGSSNAAFVGDEVTDRFCVLGPADEHVAKLRELADGRRRPVQRLPHERRRGGTARGLRPRRHPGTAGRHRATLTATRERPPAPRGVSRHRNRRRPEGHRCPAEGCGAVPGQDGLLDSGRPRPACSGHASGVTVSQRFELRYRSVPLAAAAALVIAVLAFMPGGPGPRSALAAASVNLDQWATLDHAWQNGNLNGNNTRYPEGGIVPFRLAIEGLSAGTHAIRIQYDFTAGGHKAYDFLARYDGWVSPPICAASGGGISSMCPSMPTPHYGAFPSDGFKTDGLVVRDAEAYSGVGAPDDDLGRDDLLDQRTHACRTHGREQHRRVHGPVRFDRVGRAAGMGRPPRPVALLGHGHRWPARRGGRGVRRALAHADTPARWRGESQPGPQHPAERDRRRAAAARPGTTDPDASSAQHHGRRDATTDERRRWRRGGGVPVDPPVPTAPATSVGVGPAAPPPGIRWELVALLALIAAGGFVTALARTRGPRGRHRGPS